MLSKPIGWRGGGDGDDDARLQVPLRPWLPWLGSKVGKSNDSCPICRQVSSSEAAIASMHSSVVAPDGISETQVPPALAHVSPQLWKSALSCHMTPVVPHCASVVGVEGGDDAGDG